MTQYALCIGINDYPGTHNDLSGCVNDAGDWADLLRNDFGFGENVRVLTDADATRANLTAEVERLCTAATAGDIVVVTYSGHGTWVYDQGERDESDNRDEAICAHDDNILDDEIRGAIRLMHPEAHLTVISDSCHSGSVTRAMLARQGARGRGAAEYAPKPRYMPPPDETDALRTPMIPIRKRFLYPETDMQEVLITGCNATEYSYDAYIDGRYNGAMTAMAIRIIKSDPGITYREFHRRLREVLPSTSYPQSPQLEGSDANKDRVLFT